MAMWWTPQEQAILLAQYPMTPMVVLQARLPGRSAEAIELKAGRSGVYRQKRAIVSNFGSPWTDGEIEVVRRSYLDGMTLEEIADLLPGRTPDAIRNILSKLQIRRTPAYLADVRSEVSEMGKRARWGHE